MEYVISVQHSFVFLLLAPALVFLFKMGTSFQWVHKDSNVKINLSTMYMIDGSGFSTVAISKSLSLNENCSVYILSQ